MKRYVFFFVAVALVGVCVGISGSAHAATDGISSSGTPGTVGLFTNSVERLHIDSNGNVGIGTTGPQSRLQVSGGEVQPGASSASCTSANAGAIRWTGSFLNVCNGTAWATIAMSGSTNPGTPGAGGTGYFVLSSATTTGNIGGLSGANTFCQNDLSANTWLNKPSPLNPAKVFAWLCDNSSCNNLLANTTYFYATSGSATAGGAFFTTDANGNGPGDNNQWNASNRFNIAAGYWTARFAGTSTLWSQGSAGTACSNWSTSTGGTCPAGQGTSGATDSNRWSTFALNCQDRCSDTLRLICYVNP